MASRQVNKVKESRATIVKRYRQRKRDGLVGTMTAKELAVRDTIQSLKLIDHDDMWKLQGLFHKYKYTYHLICDKNRFEKVKQFATIGNWTLCNNGENFGYKHEHYHAIVYSDMHSKNIEYRMKIPPGKKDYTYKKLQCEYYYKNVIHYIHCSRGQWNKTAEEEHYHIKGDGHIQQLYHEKLGKVCDTCKETIERAFILPFNHELDCVCFKRQHAFLARCNAGKQWKKDHPTTVRELTAEEVEAYYHGELEM